jgi:uncharacterized protein (DUF1501 family)
MPRAPWNLRRVAAPAPARAARASSDYKALVCLFLFGGNDANNLIVPTDSTRYSAYRSIRRNLAIERSALLPISPRVGDGGTYGLHPGCGGLRALFESGKLAILANVGTLLGPVTRADYLNKSAAIPPQLFSHNDQQAQWQTSNGVQPARTGWGGRAADLLCPSMDARLRMNITLTGSNLFQVGEQVMPRAVSPWRIAGRAASSASRTPPVQDPLGAPHDDRFAEGAISCIHSAIEPDDLVIGALAAAPAITTAFPETSLGRQLKMIARLIAAHPSLGQRRQIFFASVGGFDLHGDQLASHARLLSELSAAMKAFDDATSELGLNERITTFTASDFGRTLTSNGLGSDHGWGSHQLIMGGAVRGRRMYGRFPSLALNGPDDAGRGRWIPTTSVDEYGATLARWFGVCAADMPAVFPNLHRFEHPDLGFMT